MTVVKQVYNVRISIESWEKLRWAKLKTQSKSYSEVIQKLALNLAIPQPKQKELVEHYVHFRKELNRQFKTIMINKEARKTLETIKILSNDASFTLSDAIYFLIFVNSL